MMNQPIAMFALARERAGQSEIIVQLEEGATIGDLKIALADKVPALAELIPHCHIAIDRAYASDNLTVPIGAEIACIPPVSGG